MIVVRSSICVMVVHVRNICELGGIGRCGWRSKRTMLSQHDGSCRWHSGLFRRRWRWQLAERNVHIDRVNDHSVGVAEQRWKRSCKYHTSNDVFLLCKTCATITTGKSYDELLQHDNKMRIWTQSGKTKIMYEWVTKHNMNANDDMYACVTLHDTNVNDDIHACVAGTSRCAHL